MANHIVSKIKIKNNEYTIKDNEALRKANPAVEGNLSIGEVTTLDSKGNAQFQGNVYMGTNKKVATEEYVDNKVISVKINITLSAGTWSGNQYTITDAAITADSDIDLVAQSSITAEQYEELSGAMIIGGAQTDGSLTLIALGDIPTLNIPITLIIRG